MATSKFEQFLPWAGVLAGVCFAVGGYLPTGPDTPDDPARLAWIVDHQGIVAAAAVAAALLSVTALFFSAAVRAALRSGEPGESSYSSVAFAGMVAFAAGSGFTAMLQLATLDAAGKGHADAVDPRLPRRVHLGPVGGRIGRDVPRDRPWRVAHRDAAQVARHPDRGARRAVPARTDGGRRVLPLAGVVRGHRTRPAQACEPPAGGPVQEPGHHGAGVGAATS